MENFQVEGREKAVTHLLRKATMVFFIFLNLPFHISRNFYQEMLLILPTLFNNECNEGSLGQDLCSMPEISQTPASTLCPCVRQ